jgi:thiosulfate/3-mercaptopyruvate sulfurtransferase
MDGGRIKWVAEGRPLVKEVPTYQADGYAAPERDDATVRAYRDQVLAHLGGKGKLIDVRSPAEYTGERLHMPEYPNEGALRGGHIPGAANIPWAKAVREDATFKDADELRTLYEKEAGLSKGDDVIVYCRIGERSSHTWFVLTHLLGYPKVRNYDGSWTEWGNLVGVPIEK